MPAKDRYPKHWAMPPTT